MWKAKIRVQGIRHMQSMFQKNGSRRETARCQESELVKEGYVVWSDPIADMLTRIRNANMVFKEYVDIPASNLKKAICEILKKEGYIKDYKYIEDGRQGILRVYLKYKGTRRSRKRVIHGIVRVSHTGRRIYVGKREIPKVKNGLGIAILTTSKGVLTDKEARELGVGGEVIAYIW